MNEINKVGIATISAMMISAVVIVAGYGLIGVLSIPLGASLLVASMVNGLRYFGRRRLI